VSLWQNFDELPEHAQWSGLRSIIQVKSYRHVFKNGYLLVKKQQLDTISALLMNQ
jgi:hypothetical protein